jgi:hypothetical protein
MNLLGGFWHVVCHAHSEMTEFTLIEPFDVDDGSLDGLTKEACFALGVEWCMFRQKLRAGQPFSELVMKKNAHRLSKLAERNGRFVEHHPACAGWVKIVVGNQSV